MNNVTDRLLAMDPTLQRHNEGFWDRAFDPSLPGFSSFNDAGIECETGEFMYAMVRLLKPDNILETGTHFGVGASYMGLAALDNGKGVVTTIEFIPEIHRVAVDRFARLGLNNHVQSIFGDVGGFTPSTNYQLVLLDTEPITRFAELVKFYDRLDPGGFMFIHDTPRSLCQGNVNTDHPDIPSWPFGNIPPFMRQLVIEGHLRPFHFPTPRGLVGFYKVHPDDVKW